MAELLLNPGGFFFGAQARLTTLLGSCVGITLWHPRLAIGGMCHYVLDEPPRGSDQTMRGRYAEGALSLFLEALRQHGTAPGEYRVHLFGGASSLQVEGQIRETGYGGRNVAKGRELLQRHGFRVEAEHVGGRGYRKLGFDLNSGALDLKFHAYPTTQPHLAQVSNLRF